MKLRYLFYRRDLSLEEPFSSQLKTESGSNKSNTSKFDKTIRYLLNRRRESIIKSMIRPLYQEVLKCLFLVTILLVDILIPLEIYLVFPNIINIIGSVLVICVIGYVEMRIYNSLWGKNGRWSLEKYNKI